MISRAGYPIYTTLLIIVAIIAIPSSKAHNPMNVFFKNEANEIFKNKKQSLMLLLGDFDQSSTQFLAVSSVTDDYPNMLFTYSRKGIDPYDKLIELVGVYKMTPPMIIYFSSAGDKHLYQIEKFGDFAQGQNIKKFIEQAKKGGLPNFFKSGYSRQDIPDQQRAENEKYMKYYDAFTLQQDRKNSKKDLIVVVYAFWCIYSQKFAPIFRNIAKALALNPNLQFGKIDGGDNEIRGFEAAGYPTLLMWGKDKQKQPSVYFGNRKPGDVINWIKQNSEHPWVDYIELEQEKQEQKIQKISESDQMEQQQVDEYDEQQYDEQQYDEQFQQEIQQQEL